MAHALDRVKAYALIGEHDAHPWKPMPWPGVHNKVLFSDPIMGATIELAKIEKGAIFPTVQTLFLISGLITQGDRTIKPGTFDIIPAGEKHAGYYGEEDSIQFKFFSAAPVYFMEDGRIYVYKTDGEIMDVGEAGAGLDRSHQNFIYNGK